MVCFFCLVNPSNSITQVSNVRRNASLVELGIVGDELPMPKVPSLKLFQGSTYQKLTGVQFDIFVVRPKFHQTDLNVARGSKQQKHTKTILWFDRPQETVVRNAILKILSFQIGNFPFWHHARTMSSKRNTDRCHGPKTFHNPPDPQHGNLKICKHPNVTSNFNRFSKPGFKKQFKHVQSGSKNSLSNKIDFWTWPVAVRGVLAMNFPSNTSSKKKNHHAG